MRQKGFTLAELIGVIVVLAMISLVTVPAVTTSLNKYKQKLCATQLNNIEAAARTWGADNLVMLPDKDGKSIKVTLGTLSDYGYIDNEIENAITKEKFDLNDTYVTITRTGKKLKYEIDSNSKFSCSKDKENGDTGADSRVTLCRPATKLHTEECTQTDSTKYCRATGYTERAEITYGTIVNGKLKSGDAFDCDVNGDGTYDWKTERFYYVTDLEKDNNYAVLIYYNNTNKGVPDSTSTIKYYTEAENWNGPVTAITNLPTKEQWGNVSLFSKTRAITNQNDGNNTLGGTLPTEFSYEGYAARLLTYQEIKAACGTEKSPTENGYLVNCNYFMENTIYSSNLNKGGYWLETARSDRNNSVWIVYINNHDIDSYNVTKPNEDGGRGVRPVIEVNKNQLGL